MRLACRSRRELVVTIEIFSYFIRAVRRRSGCRNLMAGHDLR